MRLIPVILGLILLTACSQEGGGKSADAAPGGAPKPVSTPAPRGEYVLDPGHASLLFRVDHLGFSNYTARFTRFDAQLQFDPKAPESMIVVATIDPSSIETDFPATEELDFNEILRGEEWLAVTRFPKIRFKSTQVKLTGSDTARVRGDLSLHGITKPVVLDVKFNGGYAGHPMDPNGRIGFSAHGELNRSDFGIAFGIPPEGTKMGVSDKVDVIIEAEFTGPPLSSPAE